MKVAVLIKQVPSSEARIRIAPDGRSIVREDLEYVINPYDEYAMEAALQIKEQLGGEVTVVALGESRVEDALRTCLALGADRGIALLDEAFQGGDALGTARVLAAALQKLVEPDLVLCGKLSIDVENAAVGVQVAELCNLPHVSVVSKIEITDERHFKVHREIEGGLEEVEVELPAVLTANKGLNEPRYPSLKGIMMAKKKPVDRPDAAALGLDPSSVGKAAARVSVVSLAPPPPRAEGKIFKGEAKESVRQVVALLREEAKVL